MKDALVASVYAPSDVPWHSLQMSWLRRTTVSFEHAHWLNGDVQDDFSDSICLGHGQRRGRDSDEEWLWGIDAVMQHFRRNIGSFRCFVLLDSDAWPIRKNWVDELLSFMQAREFLYAAPARIENGDFFPHISSIVMRPEAIESGYVDDFSSGHVSDLYGRIIHDVGCNLTWRPEERSQAWLPLLRTNAVNLHPLMCGVYSHTFFHFGAGSRFPNFRGSTQYLWHDGLRYSYKEMLALMLANPAEFVNRLLFGDRPLKAVPKTTEEWWRG